MLFHLVCKLWEVRSAILLREGYIPFISHKQQHILVQMCKKKAAVASQVKK